MLKHAPPEHVLLGIRAAASGSALVSPTITMRLIASFNGADRRRTAADAAATTDISRLTPRESEVFHLVVAGQTNAEIAARLFVAESTVKTHINRILFKLHLRDRVHIVLDAHSAASRDTANRAGCFRTVRRRLRVQGQ